MDGPAPEPLTPRQQEVLDLLAEGRSNFEIAQRLGISLDGAKYHVREVLARMQVGSREEAAANWRRSRSPVRRIGSGTVALLATLQRKLLVGAALGVVAALVAAALVVLFGREDSAQRTDAQAVTSPAAPTADSPPMPGSLPAWPGPKVAWIRNDNVWVADMTGRTHQVTTEGARLRPKWSPSGEWLAYTAQSGLEVAGIGVPQASVTSNSSEFAWSPSGNVLAFISASGKVATFEPATGVTREYSRLLGTLAWSADGEEIAVAHVRTPGPTDGGLPFKAFIAVIDVRSGDERRVLTSESEDYILAGWAADRIFYWESPDGSASRVADGLPLMSLPAAGGTPQRIADALVYADSVATADDQVAVVHGGGRNSWEGKTLAVGDAARLFLKGDDVAASPAWSSDGSKIAYSSMPPHSEPYVEGGEAARKALALRKIHVLDTATGDVRPLTSDPGYRDEYPRWSADGESVVFLRIPNEGPNSASAWVVPSNGGAPRPIAEGIPTSSGWFGYYGHHQWAAFFDYWPGN